MFNNLLILIKESIIQFSVSFILFVTQPAEISDFQKANNPITFVHSSIFGIACGVFSLIILPLVFLFVLVSPETRLKNPKVQSKIGILYDDLNLASPISRGYLLLFMGHRWAIVCLALFVNPLTSIQLVSILLITLLFFIYVGSQQPFVSMVRNKVERANLTLVYWLMILNSVDTPAFPNEDLRYVIGWIQIFSIVALVVFNFYFVFSWPFKLAYLHLMY